MNIHLRCPYCGTVVAWDPYNDFEKYSLTCSDCGKNFCPKEVYRKEIKELRKDPIEGQRVTQNENVFADAEKWRIEEQKKDKEWQEECERLRIQAEEADFIRQRKREREERRESCFRVLVYLALLALFVWLFFNYYVTGKLNGKLFF